MKADQLSPRRVAVKARYTINKYAFCKVGDWLAPNFIMTQECKPVFIIGPPRCGSTLIMQTLVDAFDISYLSNAHCRWFGAPALFEKMWRPLASKKASDYTSVHGRTRADTDPAECGDWWYRFFPKQPAYVTKKDVNPRKMMAFRRSLAALAKSSGKPLVFKNLYASLRLEPIVAYVPRALFVLIERDLLDNAQSILRGRQDVYGSYEPWWSVPPPDVTYLSALPPVQQVVGQIESIHELINRDIERLGLAEKTFRTRYEDFCRDVNATLEQFNVFMASHGIDLQRRFEVPGSFTPDHSVKIPASMYKELKSKVEAKRALTAREGKDT